jgi:hypothetical protein
LWNHRSPYDEIWWWKTRVFDGRFHFWWFLMGFWYGKPGFLIPNSPIIWNPEFLEMRQTPTPMVTIWCRRKASLVDSTQS